MLKKWRSQVFFGFLRERKQQLSFDLPDTESGKLSWQLEEIIQMGFDLSWKRRGTFALKLLAESRHKTIDFPLRPLCICDKLCAWFSVPSLGPFAQTPAEIKVHHPSDVIWHWNRIFSSTGVFTVAPFTWLDLPTKIFQFYKKLWDLCNWTVGGETGAKEVKQSLKIHCVNCMVDLHTQMPEPVCLLVRTNVCPGVNGHTSEPIGLRFLRVRQVWW